jgi:hypothetical protein
VGDLTDGEHGFGQFSTRDHGGNLWSFGTYVRGERGRFLARAAPTTAARQRSGQVVRLTSLTTLAVGRWLRRPTIEMPPSSVCEDPVPAHGATRYVAAVWQ